MTNFHMGKTSGITPAPVRYAIRQVLDQELRKETLLRLSNARQARSIKLDHDGMDEHAEALPSEKHRRAAPLLSGGKRDFFGRVINEVRPTSTSGAEEDKSQKEEEPKVWVSFREGYSNAVKRPLTLKELLETF